FPPPFVPSSPKISPCFTSKLTLASAVRSPYRWVRLCTWITDRADQGASARRWRVGTRRTQPRHRAREPCFAPAPRARRNRETTDPAAALPLHKQVPTSPALPESGSRG